MDVATIRREARLFKFTASFVLQALVLASPVFAAAQQAPPASPPPSSPRAGAEAAWRSQLEAWRALREREISAPDGWLSLVALDWLKPGVNSFGAAADNTIHIANAPDRIGLLTVSGQTVQLLSPHDGFPADLTLDGKPAREGVLSVVDLHPSTLAWHSLTMIVLPRGDRYALRVKDANSPARTAFHGLNWYPPNIDYAIEARWIPSNPQRTLHIPTVIGVTLDLPSPGVAEFQLAGKTLRLDPVLESAQDTALFFILRDTTSQTTTYPAARFLRAAFPDHGLTEPGAIILDFNQLYNPPCAYTPFATCPLPPEQNRLPVAIEAGEQRYEP
jgi:uncharacterized protein (DUF1684 family)